MTNIHKHSYKHTLTRIEIPFNIQLSMQSFLLLMTVSKYGKCGTQTTNYLVAIRNVRLILVGRLQCTFVREKKQVEVVGVDFPIQSQTHT